MAWRTSRAGSTFRDTHLLPPERTHQQPGGSLLGWVCKSLNDRVTNDMCVLINTKSYAPPGRWRGSPWFVACKETRGDSSKHQGNYWTVRLLQEQVEVLPRHPFAPLVWDHPHLILLAALASPWRRSLSQRQMLLSPFLSCSVTPHL